MPTNLWISSENATSFPPDSSPVFKMYDSLKVTKVKNEIASHYLPCPHIQMEPSSCLPLASQLCPRFLLQFQVHNVQIPCHLVRERSCKFEGRSRLVQAGF